MRVRPWTCVTVGLAIFATASAVEAQSVGSSRARTAQPRDVLSPREWQEVDASVDRGLAFLVRQQQADDSRKSVMGARRRH